jgi:hypothetical protein
LVNCTLSGAVPEAVEARKAATGTRGVTVTVRVQVLAPPALVTVKVTVYLPGAVNV